MAFKQNLQGATGNTIQGAHGGTQLLGAAAQRRVEAAKPSMPMPPVKPNMAGGGLNPNGDPTMATKPLGLPGFQPGNQTPPIFAGGQQPGQPPVDQKPDMMPEVPMPGKPVFNSGAQQGVQGPGGSDQDQISRLGQIQAQIRMPGGGQILTAGGNPAGIPPGDAAGMMQAAQSLPFSTSGPGDKPWMGGEGDRYPGIPGGGLPGFMPAPGVHAMPGAPGGGILSMPGGPGQISLHGSPLGPGGLPTKPLDGGMTGIRQPPPEQTNPMGGLGGGLRRPGQMAPFGGNRY